MKGIVPQHEVSTSCIEDSNQKAFSNENDGPPNFSSFAIDQISIALKFEIDLNSTVALLARNHRSLRNQSMVRLGCPVLLACLCVASLPHWMHVVIPKHQAGATRAFQNYLGCLWQAGMSESRPISCLTNP